MADKKIPDFFGNLADQMVSKYGRERRDKRLSSWREMKRSIRDLEEIGISPPKDLVEQADFLERYLSATESLYPDTQKLPAKIPPHSSQRVEEAEEPSLWEKFRSLESTRTLLGPEPSLITGEDYKKAGSVIEREGLIPAMFKSPVDIPQIEEKDVKAVFGDSVAASVGAGLLNSVNSMTESLASVGGLATAGLSTAPATVSQVKRAASGLFAADLTRNVLETNPEVRRVVYDPNVSLQQKTEALSGQILLSLFAVGATKGALSNEMSGAKTPKDALSAAERFIDTQARKQFAFPEKQIVRPERGRVQTAESGPSKLQIEEFKKSLPDDLAKAEVPELPKDLPVPRILKEKAAPVDPLEQAMRDIESGRDVSAVMEDIRRGIEEETGRTGEAVKEVTKEAEIESAAKETAFEGMPEGKMQPPKGMLEKFKQEIAEQPKPELEKAEAVKPEKVENAAELAKSAQRAAESKVQDKAMGLVLPETGTSKRFHTIVKRRMELDQKDGNLKAVEDMLENPDSTYEQMPTSRIAEAVETMDLASVDSQLASLSDVVSVEKALLEGRKLDLLRERRDKTGLKEDADAYQNAVQERANESTFLGQLIQARNYFKGGTKTTVDLIEQAIAKDGGPILSAKERATLQKIADKASESQKKADKSAEAYRENPSQKNWDTAVKDLREAEFAAFKKLDFIYDRSPKAVPDMLISFMQGNFLTPTTLSVNFFGNTVPLPVRALSRVPAKGIDIVDQFLFKNYRKTKLETLKERQKESPTAENAAEIAKLESQLSPMEQIRLSPVSGSAAKAGGFVSSLGFKRLYQAAKKHYEKEGTMKGFIESYRKEASGPVKADVISSLLIGDRINLYEVGSLDGAGKAAPPIDAFAAGSRLIRSMTDKDGNLSRNSEMVVKDLIESTAGMAPTVMFRLLAAGDVPFRSAEMTRLIKEQAEIRGMSKEMYNRALQEPSLVFNRAELSRLQNEAAKATFQQENKVTNFLASFNKYSKGSLPEKTAYTLYRIKTPYQKTLVNIAGELAEFSPLGLISVYSKTKNAGFVGRDAKLAAGKTILGMAAFNAAQYLLDNDIVSSDLDPFMAADSSDSKSVRYMTERAFPHGHINISALERKSVGEDTSYRKGDIVMDLRRMGPLGHVLLNNANFKRHIEGLPEEDRKKLEENMSKMLAERTKEGGRYYLQTAIQQTMAQGVKEIFTGISSLASGRKNRLVDDYTKSLATALMPNTIAWWVKRDSQFKQKFNPDEEGWVKSSLESLKAEWDTKAEGLFLEDGKPIEGYPVIVDMWGTPVPEVPEGMLSARGYTEGKTDFWDRFSSSLFNVVGLRRAGEIGDPVSSEVYRLWRELRTTDSVPPMPDNMVQYKGKKYKLNKHQHAYLSARIGRYRLAGSPEISGFGSRAALVENEGAYQFIVENPEYEKMTDEDKAKGLKRIYGKQRSAAVEDSMRFFENPEANGFVRGFNLDLEKLKLKPEQEEKGPSGKAED